LLVDKFPHIRLGDRLDPWACGLVWSTSGLGYLPGSGLNFSITGATGSPVTLGGAMNIRFTLPDGFILPTGKKLAILGLDPNIKQWVELPTNASGQHANTSIYSNLPVINYGKL